MAEKKDWNAIFYERKAQHDADRAQRLRDAKAAAAQTNKEPFHAKRFKALYTRLNPSSVDKYTAWETLIRESEYDYYVVQKEITTLEALVKHLIWSEGWG